MVFATLYAYLTAGLQALHFWKRCNILFQALQYAGTDSTSYLQLNIEHRTLSTSNIANTAISPDLQAFLPFWGVKNA